MTKKDYELIARIIRGTKAELLGYKGPAIAVLNTFRDNLANELARDNDRFQMTKFFNACRLSLEEVEPKAVLN